MVRPYQYMVKIIECNNAQQLENEINTFLDTVFPGNLIDIRYQPLQMPMTTTYTAMIIYKAFSVLNDETK